MKRSILFTTLLSALLFVSCDLGGQTNAPGSYADSAAYVTTHIIESEEEDGEDKYYFETGNGYKFFLTDNAMTYEFDFVDEQRAIIYFALIEEYDEGSELEGAAYDCDFGLRLFSAYEVHVSQSATVESEEESEAIPDHAISYIYDSVGYAFDYINMVAGVRADDLDDINFYLVENLYEESEGSKEGYLDLELRYDRATKEAMGNTYDQYISLDLKPFAEQLKGKKGVMLRAVTLNSGTIYITIDIKEESERIAAPASRVL